jgi:hypothetical protein
MDLCLVRHRDTEVFIKLHLDTKRELEMWQYRDALVYHMVDYIVDHIVNGNTGGRQTMFVMAGLKKSAEARWWQCRRLYCML